MTEGNVALAMKVVVGKAFRSETPVFAKDMRYIIFRPYWNVPPSIQRRELVPQIRKNRDYLVKNAYEVTDSRGEVVSEGEVSDEILEGLRRGGLSVRQRPGPKNSLGLVKFMFPNEFDVYLHSTPATELFSRSRRDFSHGCIRVEDPERLAVWALDEKPSWTEDRIRAAMQGTDTIQVNLDNPIPVLVLLHHGGSFRGWHGEVPSGYLSPRRCDGTDAGQGISVSGLGRMRMPACTSRDYQDRTRPTST